MHRFLYMLLSIFFPWIVLLIADNPGGALVALVMQVTVLGWPFASMWAWRIAKAELGAEQKKKK